MKKKTQGQEQEEKTSTVRWISYMMDLVFFFIVLRHHYIFVSLHQDCL